LDYGFLFRTKLGVAPVAAQQGVQVERGHQL